MMKKIYYGALSILLALSLNMQAQNPQQSPTKKLSVLLYNIQMHPHKEGLRLGGMKGALFKKQQQLTSLKLGAVPAKIKALKPDVVIFTEMFTSNREKALTQNMKAAGYTHNTPVLNPSTNPLKWSGGVMVFSKYPIVNTKEIEFSSKTGWDKNARKGVLYVKINKNNVPFNIFSTHTNASYEYEKGRASLKEAGRRVRNSQFSQMRAFINALKIPQDQPVIIAGDMNVDMYSEKGKSRDQYTHMLRALRATHPSVSGHKYSFDRSTNELASRKEPSQLLDYVLYSTAHKKPKKAGNKVICLKKSSTQCKKVQGEDLSDHYPVLGTFEF